MDHKAKSPAKVLVLSNSCQFSGSACPCLKKWTLEDVKWEKCSHLEIFSDGSCMPLVGPYPFLGAICFWTYLRIWGCLIECIALSVGHGGAMGLVVSVSNISETAEISLPSPCDQFGNLMCLSLGRSREQKSSCEKLRSMYSRCLYDQ